LVQFRVEAVLTGKLSMIGVTTLIACRHKQQLLPSTKQELPARGKVQFTSKRCLEGIECTLFKIIYCLAV
jgi:hypothetical protein